MRTLPTLAFSFFLLCVAIRPVAAQIGLPRLDLPVADGVLRPLDRTLEGIGETATRTAQSLLRERDRALSRFLRREREFVEPDIEGNPARRGELLLMEAAPADLAALAGKGFAVMGEEEIAGLGFTVTRVAVPRNMKLADAQKLLALIAPDIAVVPDHIHFQSGASAVPLALGAAAVAPSVRTAVGMIDGAPSKHIGKIPARGFARGAPVASNHGSAIAYLLKGAGVTNIHAADVYGSDPAGGNALAIARALGWLVESGAGVATISLVGPKNAVLERAIAAAQRRNMVVVAAVGNDGPAAPPAYPASYKGVVSITGVDGRKRALIEAGRALHLDYAAPGADIFARKANGGRMKLRGTSFATPLAAARIARAMDGGGNWRARVDREAEDLGKPGADETFGRGLICGDCGGL